MVKLQYTGKQYTLTISEDNIKRMGWKKGDNLYIAKLPDKTMLYIEKMR